MSALEEHLNNLYEVPDLEENQDYQFNEPIPDSKADWGIRRLQQLRRKKEENKKLAEEQIEQIKMWLEQENGRIEQNEEYFNRLLTTYHIQKLEEDPAQEWEKKSTKTLRLPSGTLQARKSPQKLEIDEKTVLAWVEENGQEKFIRTKRELNKADLRKGLKVLDNGVVIIEETGEPVPGIQVIPGEIKYGLKE